MELFDYIHENMSVRILCVDEDWEIPSHRFSKEHHEYIKNNRGENPWLWCAPVVFGNFGPFSVRRALRECSYESKQEFMDGPEFSTAVTSMIREIVENIQWVRNLDNE
jgi:hypothetical protein